MPIPPSPGATQRPPPSPNARRYLNFFDAPQQSFFKRFAALKAQGDLHWLNMWGKLHAGPFNTQCLADGTSHTRPTGNTCVDKGEPLPPLATASAENSVGRELRLAQVTQLWRQAATQQTDGPA